ncbi:MAG: glycosyltransferase family 4 protein [Nitrospirota bacterium]|nr:glycosyltransferase family 4 protein [Nitrospirota bacterium]
MSLAVNASIVDPYASGLGVYTIQLVKELEKIRQDLIVYTSCSETFQLTSAKSRNIFFPLAPAYGKKAHVARLIWTQTVLPVRLFKDNISQIFSPIPEYVLGTRIPQTVVVHDLIPIKFPQDYPFQYQYFRWYVAPLLRKAKTIITVSEQSKADLIAYLKINPCHINVVPGGCNHDDFHLHIDPNQIKLRYGLHRYLLYVGNLHPHKNPARLIQAFARFASRVPHQLIIVGKKDPRFYPSLEMIVGKLGLHGRVVFLDYVKQKELGGIYAGAELFVFPSLYEGFGLPLVEAMACGIPVVSGNRGATAEVVGDAGILVDSRSVKDLAEALEYVLTTQGIRQDLRQRGLRRAQRFRWETTAKQVSEIIGGVSR